MSRRSTLRTLTIEIILLSGLGYATSAVSQTISVLVAYHSVSGNTEKMAQGVVEGIKAVPGATAILKRVQEVNNDDLLSADAVVIGSPVYFGNMAGEVKLFFGKRGNSFLDCKRRHEIGRLFCRGGSFTSRKRFTILSIDAV